MSKGKAVLFGLNWGGIVLLAVLLCVCPPLSWCFVWAPWAMDWSKGE